MMEIESKIIKQAKEEAIFRYEFACEEEFKKVAFVDGAKFALDKIAELLKDKKVINELYNEYIKTKP